MTAKLGTWAADFAWLLLPVHNKERSKQERHELGDAASVSL